MTCISRTLGAAAGALVLSLTFAPGAVAAKPFPGLDQNEWAPVARVVVPVPVDDLTNEILQMEIAAALGAAGAVACLRWRRRSHHPPPRTGAVIPMR